MLIRHIFIVLQDELVKDAQQKLTDIFITGARVLAEFSGVCVEHLSSLGKSLYAQARYKRKDKSFHWPDSPTAIASIVKHRASTSPICCNLLCMAYSPSHMGIPLTAGHAKKGSVVMYTLI